MADRFQDPFQDPFYDHFLSELRALDEFLLRRAGAAGPVTREDPDVRRLLESVAFFSARSRQAAADGVREAVQRLAGAHLDELLAPQPARGLVQAMINDRLVDPAYLPRGTEMRLVAQDGTTAIFTTMHGVTLLPLSIQRAELALRPGRGFRLLIGLHARTPLRSLPDPLALHIDYLGDYAASSRFLYRLREHIEEATVVYGDAPAASARGLPCELLLGAPRPREDEPHRHPLSELRAFFHFPRKDLFVNLRLPAPERPWKRAWLCLDLDEQWPEDLVVNKEIFRLFVVPIENLRRDLAEPITCDGTRSSHSLRPVAPHANDVLHSVTGVYEETDAGTEPILPAHLATGRDAYELDAGGAEPMLVLRLPDAFEQPRKIAVEALWYRPRFDAHAHGYLDVSLQTRRIEGVSFRVHGRLAPHRSSPLWLDPFEMVRILALENKSVLARGEILRLMALLGADDTSELADMPERVARIAVEDVPGAKQGSVVRVYRVTLAELADDQKGLMFDFLARLWVLLDVWSASPVELRIDDEGRARRKRPRIADPMLAGASKISTM